MTERQYAVAIDGPSGAGKSTLARAAAEALHILYVDTGAIYRTIGVYMYRHDIAPTDAPAVIAALPEITVALRYDEEGLQRMYLNGEDVTKEIRLPMISKYASDVSAIPEVRAFLMELQRSLAREHSVIMDGRDIGTVVLPDAEVKVFLCADVETRARRRFLELEQRGTPKPFDEVLRDMEQRDYNDTHRAAAPLRPADDAIMIDNTDMGLRGQPGAAAGCDTGACGIVRNKFYAAAWRCCARWCCFSCRWTCEGRSIWRAENRCCCAPITPAPGTPSYSCCPCPSGSTCGSWLRSSCSPSPSWVDSCGRSVCFRWIGATVTLGR